MSVPSAPTMCHATDASFRFKRQTNRYRDTHTHRQRHTFQTFKIPFICTFCFTFHPPEAIQCNADLPKKKKKKHPPVVQKTCPIMHHYFLLKNDDDEISREKNKWLRLVAFAQRTMQTPDPPNPNRCCWVRVYNPQP